MAPHVDAELERIANRIRRWREEAELTLQELAKRSGVATSTIQKVETLQMIPTVAVLLKIARGLGRRSAEFVSDGGESPAVVHLRPGERRSIGARQRMTFERLSGDLFDPAIELWRIVIQPGKGSGRDSLRYEGEDVVLCEEGEVTFRIGEEEYLLRPGDTLHFKASVPHTWRNESDLPARFLIAGTLPVALRAALHDRLTAGPGQRGRTGRRPRRPRARASSGDVGL